MIDEMGGSLVPPGNEDDAADGQEDVVEHAEGMVSATEDPQDGQVIGIVVRRSR